MVLTGLPTALAEVAASLIEHRLHGRWIGDKDKIASRSHRLLNRGVKIRKRPGRSIPTAHGIAVVY